MRWIDTRTKVACGVLGDVGQRLADDVVGGGLDRAGEPLRRSSTSQLDRAAARGRRPRAPPAPGRARSAPRGGCRGRARAAPAARGRAPRPPARDRRRRDAGARPAAASAPATRAAAARRRAGCAPAAGARRHPPARCGRATPRAPPAPARWPAPARPARRSRRSAARRPPGTAAGPSTETITAPHSAPPRKIGAATTACTPYPRMRRRQLALGALVGVHPRRAAGAPHARRGGVAVHRHPRAGRQHVLGPQRPAADDRAAARPSASKRNMCAVCASSSLPDLLADQREQPRRIVLGRHRRRHAPQRGLLVRQPVQRGLGDVAGGQVAQIAVEDRARRARSGRVTTSSTGNSVPSRRIAVSSTRRPTIGPRPSQVAREPLAVRLAQRLGDDQRRELAARPSPPPRSRTCRSAARLAASTMPVGRPS